MSPTICWEREKAGFDAETSEPVLKLKKFKRNFRIDFVFLIQ
jgi:hypothetical protein